MTLKLDLPPQLETQLAQAAAEHGQSLPDYARSVLERSVAPAPPAARGPGSFDLGSPALPRRTPADLLELARQQGVSPVTDFNAFIGGWPEGEDVDDFLEARKQWQREGRQPGGLDDEPS